VSGQDYPTINERFPAICDIELHVTNAIRNVETWLHKPGTEMLWKFKKYWEYPSNFVLVAIILDPRYKLDYIRWFFSEKWQYVDVENRIDNIWAF
jgi:hypothetical protein